MRFSPTSCERVHPCQRQAHFRARRVEFSCFEKLVLCLFVAAGLDVGESEVCVAERIVGSKPGELPERGLRLRQLIPLQVAEGDHAGGVELFHRHRFFMTSNRYKNPGGNENDGPRSPEHSEGHAQTIVI